MANDSRAIAVFSKNGIEIICVIDEQFNVIELVEPAKLGQNLSRHLLICGRIGA